MAHPHNCAKRQVRQFHCRRRRCLLKGCTNFYRPKHPQSRYCSAECRALARRWARARARRRYRASTRGKAHRRAQSGRYRERCKTRRARALHVPEAEKESCEGDQGSAREEVFLCARPGCYELVQPELRSPGKCFCSRGCCRALGRVHERERRWRARLVSLGKISGAYSKRNKIIARAAAR